MQKWWRKLRVGIGVKFVPKQLKKKQQKMSILGIQLPTLNGTDLSTLQGAVFPHI